MGPLKKNSAGFVDYLIEGLGVVLILCFMVLLVTVTIAAVQDLLF